MQNRRLVPRAEQCGGTQAIVGCRSECGDLKVAIVDPQTRSVCGLDEVGEIWVNGGSVRTDTGTKKVKTPKPSGLTFRQWLREADYLRTGGLGFKHAGELFITGR